tara:strand:- start:83 stop:478 length:396 start_codon:yes stop_codon:yes gene_type:complete
MDENFKIEIIGPEKIIFSHNIKMVTLPSYEGEMSILKNHIPIITFLRPGVIRVEKNDGSLEHFFAQDGTIEYSNDSLVVLSSSAINIKELSKDFLDTLVKDTKKRLEEKNITDHDRYMLNHKLSTINNIRI